MSEPDPSFDAVHPSGQVLFRSCRGGYLHTVALSEEAMGTRADTLAEAVLRAAQVSHLKAVMGVREEIILANPPVATTWVSSPSCSLIICIKPVIISTDPNIMPLCILSSVFRPIS